MLGLCYPQVKLCVCCCLFRSRFIATGLTLAPAHSESLVCYYGITRDYYVVEVSKYYLHLFHYPTLIPALVLSFVMENERTHPAHHHVWPWLTWCKGGACTAWIKRLLGSGFQAECDCWCWEAVVSWAPERDLGSASLWVLVLLWSQIKWFTMQWVRRSVLERDFRRTTQFSGFSSRNQIPLPCRLRKAPTLIITHNYLRLLEPGANRRMCSYGVRTWCCQCWYLDKWEGSWANHTKSEDWKN